MKRAFLLLILASGCSRDSVAEPAAKPVPPAPTKAPMQPPPPPSLAPATGDTTRYAAWLKQNHVTTSDTLRENLALRLGDWGFFDVFAGPGKTPTHQAGIDKANHAIQPSEKGDWFAFLTASGNDATKAAQRVAWLAQGVSAEEASVKAKAPTLTVTKDSATLVAYFVIPGPASVLQRVTVTATPSGANKFVIDRP